MGTSGNVVPGDTDSTPTNSDTRMNELETPSAAGGKPKRRRRLYYFFGFALIICLMPHIGFVWCCVLAVPVFLLIRRLPPYTAGRLLQPTPRSAQRSSKAGGIGWGTVLLTGAIFYGVNENRRNEQRRFAERRGMHDSLQQNDQQRQSAPANRTGQNASAAQQQPSALNLDSSAAERYWREAVESCFRVRFLGAYDGEADEPVTQFTQRYLTNLRQATSHARNVSTLHVRDRDLLDMMSRHLDVDNQLLKVAADIQALGNRSGLPPSSLSVQEAEDVGWHVLSFAASDSDELPHELRELLLKLADVVAECEESRVETVVMQARLQERYPDRTFILPELPAAAE